MTPVEIARVQEYLRRKFNMDRIRVVARPTKDDSAEVKMGEEFIGVLFKDTEDGEVTYQFNMAILEMDLEEGI